MKLCAIAGLSPLQDCDNYNSLYGYGTYMASLIGGLQSGVAKNVTLWSGVQRVLVLQSVTRTLQQPACCQPETGLLIIGVSVVGRSFA